QRPEQRRDFGDGLVLTSAESAAGPARQQRATQTEYLEESYVCHRRARVTGGNDGGVVDTCAACCALRKSAGLGDRGRKRERSSYRWRRRR
ncbi:ORFL294W, partial [Human betaherpesvirus 5]